MKSDGNINSKTKLTWSVLSLLKSYFTDSDRKLMAWFLLVGVIACIVGSVFLFVHLSVWSASFWTVMAAKDTVLLAASVKEFFMLVSAYVVLNAIKKIFTGKLILSWRGWLTSDILDKLIEDDRYLALKRSIELKDWHQRVQEDIKNFIKSAPNLFLTLIESSLLLGGFARTLWVVGGSLSFIVLGINVVIPGYLLWFALGLAAASSGITYWIGKSLSEKNSLEKTLEGNFRRSLHTLDSEAENIALEHAGEYHKILLKKQIQQIQDNAEKKNYIHVRVDAFRDFYTQISSYIPMLLCIPLYFSGLMELGEIMQVSMAFSQVNGSFSFFTQMYDDLANCYTAIQRSIELQNAIESRKSAEETKIIRREKIKDSIKIKGLTIEHPRKDGVEKYLIHDLNLKLLPGKTVIQAPSGYGKSTLFKVISGSWSQGSGTITLPKDKRIYCLPQKPTFLVQTLYEVLAYPDKASKYTMQEYRDVLTKVRKADLIGNLHKVCNWEKELSGGEQQLISIARLLLIRPEERPDWVLGDEATSALDSENKKFVQQLLDELPDVNYVSIVHDDIPQKSMPCDSAKAADSLVGEVSEAATSTVRPYDSIIRFFKTEGSEKKFGVEIQRAASL